MNNCRKIWWVGLVLFFTTAKANLKPNSLFSNNAVLQQGVVVPVWGVASDGEKVSVDFAGQHVSTVAAKGKWMVKLRPLKAGGPFTMTIKGDNVVIINNVMVGEVWLCSGQSNIEWPLYKIIPQGNYPTLKEVLREAQNYPAIRQFFVPLHTYTDIPPQVDDVNGQWTVCDSATAKRFSAVAYFFAKDLYNRLQVPIGFINSTYGGTPAENWTSEAVLDSIPGLKNILANYRAALNSLPVRQKNFDDNKADIFAKFKVDSATAAQQHKDIPNRPLRPINPADRGGPSGLYNTMLAPLIPFAIKGVVWYQGEANADGGVQYRTLFPAMINNWRSAWAMNKMPFLFVQIPGWKGIKPELREAQLLTWQTVPYTSMAVITDCDDTVSVHPPNKQPVGERLALAARAIAYHDKIEYAGPEYKSMRINGDRIELDFTHIGTGLVSKNGELRDFTIAGDDKKFVVARAIIRGNKVIVFSPEVARPVSVRLGWRVCPQVNLYNKEGLVASAFRTDCY